MPVPRTLETSELGNQNLSVEWKKDLLVFFLLFCSSEEGWVLIFWFSALPFVVVFLPLSGANCHRRVRTKIVRTFCPRTALTEQQRSLILFLPVCFSLTDVLSSLWQTVLFMSEYICILWKPCGAAECVDILRRQSWYFLISKIGLLNRVTLLGSTDTSVCYLLWCLIKEFAGSLWSQ